MYIYIYREREKNPFFIIQVFYLSLYFTALHVVLLVVCSSYRLLIVQKSLYWGAEAEVRGMVRRGGGRWLFKKGWWTKGTKLGVRVQSTRRG